MNLHSSLADPRPCIPDMVDVGPRSAELRHRLVNRARERASTSSATLKFHSLEAVVLGYGTAFDVAHRSAVEVQGPMGQCFANASSAARATANSSAPLQYCEGFSLPPESDILYHHAWLVDAQGDVVDPTWTDADGGVPLRGVARRGVLRVGL